MRLNFSLLNSTKLYPVIPIPGVKLGIANIVTVYAVIEVGKPDAVQILLARILLSFVFAGQAVSLMFSLGGGVMCLIVMIMISYVVDKERIWVMSVAGALSHNIGQILVAWLIVGSKGVFFYLPILIITGILTGALTGVTAQMFIKRIGGKTRQK